MLKRGESEMKKEDLGQGRFNVPDIEKFYEGNKTIIKNFKKIAKYLDRSPKQLFKFYLNKLATNGELRNNCKRAEFTGRFSISKLNEALEEYVDKYVRCPECGKPDTDIIKKEGHSFMKCMACGAESPIN